MRLYECKLVDELCFHLSWRMVLRQQQQPAYMRGNLFPPTVDNSCSRPICMCVHVCVLCVYVCCLCDSCGVSSLNICLSKLIMSCEFQSNLWRLFSVSRKFQTRGCNFTLGFAINWESFRALTQVMYGCEILWVPLSKLFAQGISNVSSRGFTVILRQFRF